MLYDCNTESWRQLGPDFVNDPTWSRDSEFIYVDGVSNRGIAHIYRVRISDGQVETVSSLNGIRRDLLVRAGFRRSPLLLRELGYEETYALDREWP